MKTFTYTKGDFARFENKNSVKQVVCAHLDEVSKELNIDICLLQHRVSKIDNTVSIEICQIVNNKILKTANGKMPNGFSIFPDFSISNNNDGEYSLFTTLETDNKDLLPIGVKDKDLTIAVIKLYKFAHSQMTTKK